jgi:hypothetical protein
MPSAPRISGKCGFARSSGCSAGRLGRGDDFSGSTGRDAVRPPAVPLVVPSTEMVPSTQESWHSTLLGSRLRVKAGARPTFQQRPSQHFSLSSVWQFQNQQLRIRWGQVLAHLY